MLLNHPSFSRRLAAILSIFLLNGCLEGRSDKSESGGMAIETPTAATVDAQMPSGLVTNTNQGGVMPALGGEVSDEADQGVDLSLVDMTTPDMAIPDMALDAPEDAAMPACTRDFECNDNNPCTDDICEAGECVNTHNEAPCEDGVYCNGAEKCSEGVCRLGSPPCPSPEECDEDNRVCLACDADNQCPEPDVISSTPCTYADRCVERGQQTQTILEYTCQDRECVGQRGSREAVCSASPMPCPVVAASPASMVSAHVRPWSKQSAVAGSILTPACSFAVAIIDRNVSLRGTETGPIEVP